MRESALIKQIEEDLKLQYLESQKAVPGELDSKWKFLTSTEPDKFINKDLTLNIEVLRNFRKLSIFISDGPTTDYSNIFNTKNLLMGARRGMKRQLKEILDLVGKYNYIGLLEKYPCNNVGNPHVFNYKGYCYTCRWIRHILLIGLFNDVLKKKLNKGFTVLDIGSSYGIFSYILKNECPDSHHLLLDFPEQLVLAYYFLGMSFPNAKIAGYKEVSEAGKIDRDFMNKYDFVLVPWFLYGKIAPKSLDLVTNFASLGEMKREWFNYYVKSEPFLSAKYFFTANRFQSAPEYDTDLTILDYPLNDFRKLHFRISPYFTYCYVSKNLFFYEKFNFSSQYFEFIGERIAK